MVVARFSSTLSRCYSRSEILGSYERREMERRDKTTDRDSGAVPPETGSETEIVLPPAQDEDMPPSSRDIEAMLTHIGSEARTEAARDLANAIAESWRSGEVSSISCAVKALLDWLATAEEAASPDEVADILAAKESLARGEGVSWGNLRAELGL